LPPEVEIETARFTFAPRGPYSLAATAERFTRWPEVVDRFDGTTYRRLLPVGRRGVLLEARQLGTISRARLAVRLIGPGARSPEARAAAERVVAIGLGAALDTRPFDRAFRGDRLLGGALAHARGLRIAGAATLFEAAVTAVLAQQVNLVFAYDIRRELSLAFGRRVRLAGETFVAFPAPERIARLSPRSLRRFRLSRAKAGALVRLARAFAAGRLSESALEPLSDEKAVERLTAIKGVGRWTAEIALLRGLGRADVFPGGDLGVVKYVAMELLGHRARVDEARMRRFAERWRPFRGLALAYAYAEIARRRRASKG
jgi:DNA-3-methyladenine glycosylase II